MIPNTTDPAESALLATRNRLHALDIPADDIPDDLLDVAVGGSLMPSLPGWTKRRARDWAALAIDRPVVAKTMIDWANRNVSRLANLEWITAWLTIAVPGLILSMGRRDFGPGEDFGREVAEMRGQINLSGSAQIDEMRIDGALDDALARLNRIPRPWHAELTAAIAAARRGEVEPGLIWATASRTDPAFYRLTASTELRVLPFAALLAWQSSVNSGPFCGAEVGELRLATTRTERLGEEDRPRSRLEYGFDFRPGLPWSRRLCLDGGFAEALDPAGNPAYEMADFYELP